jgi:hypothetical protein
MNISAATSHDYKDNSTGLKMNMPHTVILSEDEQSLDSIRHDEPNTLTVPPTGSWKGWQEYRRKRLSSTLGACTWFAVYSVWSLCIICCDLLSLPYGACAWFAVSSVWSLCIICYLFGLELLHVLLHENESFKYTKLLLLTNSETLNNTCISTQVFKNQNN